MDFAFTEDQQLLRDTVAEFARTEILPHVRKAERIEDYLQQR